MALAAYQSRKDTHNAFFDHPFEEFCVGADVDHRDRGSGFAGLAYGAQYGVAEIVRQDRPPF
jgi:hypothetical protein